jgi:hypothetical protein
LKDRPFIKVQAQPFQAIYDDFYCPFHFPRLVSILDAQDKNTVRVPRKKPVKKSGPDVAHMRVTGRTGRKTDSNLIG